MNDLKFLSSVTRNIQKVLLAAVLMAALSCGNGNFTDPRDGKVYKTVKIGDQVWMAENLNFEIADSSFCYKDDKANCDKFGRLYTWNAAMKAVPPGWHLPSKEEWEKLIQSFGGTDSVAFARMVQGGESGFNALTGIGSRDESGAYLTSAPALTFGHQPPTAIKMHGTASSASSVKKFMWSAGVLPTASPFVA